ncbi:MAG: ferrous iron transport protein B [Tunicatimonas sp.]
MSRTTTIPAVDSRPLSIALVGNPNAGKSSLFNHLTGLNQKVGNYPGVTVDKKIGRCVLGTGSLASVVDLPGTYSVFPRSADEQVVLDHLLSAPPDAVVAVVDATNLERGLLLATQLIDLALPVVLVLNMADVARRQGLEVNTVALSQRLGGVPVVMMNARRGEGIDDLKAILRHRVTIPNQRFFDARPLAPEAIATVRNHFDQSENYAAYLLLQQGPNLRSLTEEQQRYLSALRRQYPVRAAQWQIKETTERYRLIRELLHDTLTLPSEARISLTDRLDRLVTHRVGGYLIFFGLLFLIFQAIFAWATVPMDFIDYLFSELSGWIKNVAPAGALTDLLAEGIVPGIGGVVIFIPQIAILFAFIALLEESGYMARVVFLMDKLMRKVGLNGRSVVPLISGLACAIPAIMATRSIDHWKDRLITIFVTPLMSCSARLPVYTILIALVVPNEPVIGFINLPGLALMGLYLLGFAAAMISALVMKYIIRAKGRGFLIMELPEYRWPRWHNVALTVVQKSRTFVWEAGRVILAVSVVLWVLASYGPGDGMERAEAEVRSAEATGRSVEELDNLIASARLENSFAGRLGHWIEPVIRPLGYDWKIGIALITSFAAREVFVGTMATLYSVGADFEDDSTIKSRMREEVNPRTGERQFTPAVAFSLLVFYAFAMQCMSTIAIVHRETKGWRWPLIQTAYMTALAYLSALVVYQVMG